MLKWLTQTLGKFSRTDTVNGIRPKLVQLALDQLANRPGWQSNMRSLLVTIDKWAAPRELLARQITFGVQIVGYEGGHVPWTDAQVALGYAHARYDFPKVIKLMSKLGQRGSDIVRLRLNDIAHEENPLNGQRVPGIKLAQQKTGLGLWVPFDEELADLIETWRPEILARGAPWLLVRSPQGAPYERKVMTVDWQAERRQDALRGLADLGYRTRANKPVVLHGLRGTRVVSLRKAGASVPMISAMIGMSANMVARYSRFADQVDLALAAVHKLDFGTARTKTTPVKSVSA
jgi:integrase